MRRKKIAEPPVYEKGSNETTLDPHRKWSVNAFKVDIANVLFLKKVTESIFRILCESYFSELISNLDFILNTKQQNIIENLDLGLYQCSSLDIFNRLGTCPGFR
jgi:hypothetical protein